MMIGPANQYYSCGMEEIFLENETLDSDRSYMKRYKRHYALDLKKGWLAERIEARRFSNGAGIINERHALQ
jgi:hypothetical protein